jgi:lysophospholipase L1-like esterase
MISKRTKLRLFALLFALACGLIVSEIALRLINYRPILMDPGLYVANDSDILPFKLKANYDGLYAGQQVRTDADGYRVVSPDPRLAQSTRIENPERVVLILGDSAVFGHGLSDEETIASQLQNLILAKKLNYQVKNIGVSGYTSWNEYGSLEGYLKQHTATDVIVLYIPNDITFENDYFGVRRGNLPSFAQRDTAFLRFTRFLYAHFYTAFLISDGIKKTVARVNNTEGYSGKFDLANRQPEFNYSMEALGKMQELCQQRQMRFAVAIYRDVEHYYEPEKSLAYEAAIKKSLDARGIKSFVAKSHIENLKFNEAKVLWNDPHPSARAVTFIAGDFLKALE